MQPLTSTHRPLISMMGGLLFAVSCSPGGSVGSSAPSLTYSMERDATGITTNALLLDYPTGTGYQFKISATGLTSDTEFDVFLPMQPRVEFYYTSLGTQIIDLEIQQANGTPYIADTLTWVYSTYTPMAPIVSFSELATSDADVTMLIASSREPETREIWVEGDLNGSQSAGFWADLPDSGLYPLKVSADDGLKTMSVKLRNIYGNESEAVIASILRKSNGPTNCTAEFEGGGTASRLIELKLSAVNNGPLYYNVYGDVDTTSELRPFTSGDSVQVKLTSGEGEKKLTIRIQDAAGNRCEDIKETLTLSAGYVTNQLSIEGEPLWTNDASVNLLLRYDHFANQEPIEMKITGDVHGSNINTWLPFAAAMEVDLMPGSGERKIYVQYRDKTLAPTFLVLVRVYHEPKVTLEAVSAGVVDIVTSKIRGTDHITITGCAEIYTEHAYQSVFPCTYNAATVDVNYLFADGTSLVLSATP